MSRASKITSAPKKRGARAEAGTRKQSKKKEKEEEEEEEEAATASPPAVCEESTDLVQLNWPARIESGNYCDKCLFNVRDVLFKPCRDVVLCVECVQEDAKACAGAGDTLTCRRCKSGITSGERVKIFAPE